MAPPLAYPWPARPPAPAPPPRRMPSSRFERRSPTASAAEGLPELGRCPYRFCTAIARSDYKVPPHFGSVTSPLCIPRNLNPQRFGFRLDTTRLKSHGHLDRPVPPALAPALVGLFATHEAR
jgi:hypothetical protein